MKKVFLMLAFAGLVGSVSASTNFDDKDKGKKDSKKEAKSCCKEKAGAEGKSCSGDKKESKSCCKDKKTAEAKPAETK
ncbi:MAG: hypothetical protein K0R26_1859 [Bacteroidota bacterium]|nr:hypothetical protein [Bacteroidota bacterium]